MEKGSTADLLDGNRTKRGRSRHYQMLRKRREGLEGGEANYLTKIMYQNGNSIVK
jgi:hypothetical protein